MRRFAKLFTLTLFLFAAQKAFAQPSKVLPTEPTEFIEEFVSRLNKFGNKELQNYTKEFEARWRGGQYVASEQERFIGQVNIMLLKNYPMNPEILNYAKTFEALKAETALVKLEPEHFFMAADSCILLLDRKKSARYYKFIREYVSTGAAFKTSNASWTLSQTDPTLKFGTFVDEELGKKHSFPYLVFAKTDLTYRNPKDSTKIYETSGQLNIFNKMFDGEGGRIDWTKMGLDASDVYADVTDYGLNLNFSVVKIDTVIFHYSSLIDKPLKGKFEDINKGFRNINKANYPYFRSYDGGVVIENFIPNVRYEGGFSLRGIRKIGSAYFEMVDIPKEELEESESEDDGIEEVEDTYEDDFGYEYDDNAFILSDDDMIEDTWGEDETDVAEAEDELGGGDFDDDFNPDFLNKELKLFKAQLTIFRNEEPAMNLRANEFILDLEKLVSRRTEVALYIN
ncbi:MAG: hypothetical protein AAF570_23565, partial [Bacteroidota bacterium]